jgi:hypothetical protein
MMGEPKAGDLQEMSSLLSQLAAAAPDVGYTATNVHVTNIETNRAVLLCRD